uniref:Uncharacterized protein n=1 Tax=Ditylum brightwellii TaxID=49249 RepID=A0A6U3VEP7_9STRA|mmetsp:Transcript_7814/g.11645  ORF Transcript_7814/g.11645 Transcript_7814/m.11645 type:complete len:471 (+) Transcript_7814:439-1851(+)
MHRMTHLVPQGDFENLRQRQKKAEWMKCIQKCFYVDDNCVITLKDDDPMWCLIESTRSKYENNGSIGDNGNMNGSHVTRETITNGKKQLAAPESTSSTSAAVKGSRKRRRPDSNVQSIKIPKLNGVNTCESKNDNPPNSNTHKSALAKIVAEQVKVKREKIDYDYACRVGGYNMNVRSLSSHNTDRYETRPKDFSETNYVNQLKGMGFADMREMLSGIRHVQNAGSSNVIDDAMMWIVTQREEEAEARKLDEARISSEYALTEEQQRVKDVDEQLHKSSLNDILKRKSEFFPSSFVLQCGEVMAILCQINGKEGKDLVIRYLTLEQRAKKWYGTVVPWAYFCYVARERIISFVKDLEKKQFQKENKFLPSEYICSKLRAEVNELETSLYSLSEQEEGGVGRVPKIFLAARRDAKKNGLPLNPEKHLLIGESDDDIIVVEEPGDKESLFSNATEENEKKTTEENKEIIEID